MYRKIYYAAYYYLNSETGFPCLGLHLQVGSPVAQLLYNRNRWDPHSRSSCQAHFMLARTIFIHSSNASEAYSCQPAISINIRMIISCTGQAVQCTFCCRPIPFIHSFGYPLILEQATELCYTGQDNSFLHKHGVSYLNRSEHSDHSIPIKSRTIHSYSGPGYSFLYTARPFIHIHIQTMGNHSFLFKPRPFINSCTSHLFLHWSGEFIPLQANTMYSYTDQDQ